MTAASGTGTVVDVAVVVDEGGTVSAGTVVDGTVVATADVDDGDGADVSVGALSPEHAATVRRPTRSVAVRR